MKRSDIKEAPEYFDNFIKLVDDIELTDAFDKSLKQIDDLDISQLKRMGHKAYADGKWSINKIIQHLADLPLWLARYNKEIFGPLFAVGLLFTFARWLGWLG